MKCTLALSPRNTFIYYNLILFFRMCTRKTCFGFLCNFTLLLCGWFFSSRPFFQLVRAPHFHLYRYLDSECVVYGRVKRNTRNKFHEKRKQLDHGCTCSINYTAYERDEDMKKYFRKYLSILYVCVCLFFGCGFCVRVCPFFSLFFRLFI